MIRIGVSERRGAVRDDCLKRECVAGLLYKALDEIWENGASRQHTGSWLNRIKPAQHWVMGSATGLYVPPPPSHSPHRSTAATSPPLSQDNVPWPQPPSQMNIHYHSFVQIFSWILLLPHPPPPPSAPLASPAPQRGSEGVGKGAGVCTGV
ncbi:hypothetical protein AOLI_G00085220 [Acnodon oligacanthus]